MGWTRGGARPRGEGGAVSGDQKKIAVDWTSKGAVDAQDLPPFLGAQSLPLTSVCATIRTWCTGVSVLSLGDEPPGKWRGRN